MLRTPGQMPRTSAADVGYQPSTPIEVGVKNFVDWYLEFYYDELKQSCIAVTCIYADRKLTDALSDRSARLAVAGRTLPKPTCGIKADAAELFARLNSDARSEGYSVSQAGDLFLDYSKNTTSTRKTRKLLASGLRTQAERSGCHRSNVLRRRKSMRPKIVRLLHVALRATIVGRRLPWIRARCIGSLGCSGRRMAGFVNAVHSGEDSSGSHRS